MNQKDLWCRLLHASCKTATLLMLVCLATLASSTVPVRAQAYDELYFQSALSPWSQDHSYLMDTAPPDATSRMYNSSQAEFETRVLASDQTFMYYHLKLWITPGEADMLLPEEYLLHAYVGAHIEGQSPRWSISDQKLIVPMHTVLAEFQLNSVPVTVVAGQRLMLRLELSFYGQLFFWGNSTRPSSLVTTPAVYQGVPVPEFPFPTSLLLIALVATVIGVKQRHSRRISR
jgi:hypothetical protein